MPCSGPVESYVHTIREWKLKTDEINNPNQENSKVQTTTDLLLIKDNIVKAEIHLALESLMSNYWYNSCSSKSELFSAMFSDSDIAEKFSMEKTKFAYYVTHGIARYIVGLLKAYNYYHFIQFHLMSLIMMP